MSFCDQALSQCVREMAPFKTDLWLLASRVGDWGRFWVPWARSIPLDYQGLGFGSWLGDRVWLMVAEGSWEVAQAPPCDLGVEQLAGSYGIPTVTPGPLRPGREPQPAMGVGV